jgi:hypothetical protein
VLAFASGAAEADQAILPLGNLIGEPEAIVLGLVLETRDGRMPGEFLLDIEVEEALKGGALSRLTLTGNDRYSDSFPRLLKGTRILSFLQKDPTGLAPVGGEQGLIVVGSASADVAREIVLRGLKLGASLGLTDFDDLLRAGTPVPPAILGSLTEELSLRVTQKDQSLVGEIACDSQQAFLPAVQLWAMSRVGPLQVRDARPCLEQFLRDRKNETRAIAASEALGELRDPESAPAIIAFLESLPADRRIIGPDRKGDSSVAIGDEDPEEEREPRPDPEEDSSPGGIEDLPAPPAPGDRDGERAPDGTPSSDRPSRGAGGGMAESSILALGKIGDLSAVPVLFRIAREGDDLGLHSTAVNALGLIGGRTVLGPLRSLSRTHANPLVREQARETYERLRKRGGAR